MKKKVTISLEEETASKLKMLAEGSNVSQWITDKVNEATQPTENELNGAIAFSEAMSRKEGGSRPLNSYECQAIRRAMYTLYKKKPSPTLSDFYDSLLADNTPEASNVALLVEYECSINGKAALKPLVRVFRNSNSPIAVNTNEPTEMIYKGAIKLVEAAKGVAQGEYRSLSGSEAEAVREAVRDTYKNNSAPTVEDFINRLCENGSLEAQNFARRVAACFGDTKVDLKSIASFFANHNACL